MNQDKLQELIRTGLPALDAGGRIAAAATDEINASATDPELKAALAAGNDTAKEWRTRVEQAMAEAGAGGEAQNPVVEAHYQTAKYIRDAAPDDQTRDLGFIAAGQLALHYWVAAFGTMAAYAEQAGLAQTAQAMRQSVAEAKEADAQQTQIAARIMG